MAFWEVIRHRVGVSKSPGGACNNPDLDVHWSKVYLMILHEWPRIPQCSIWNSFASGFVASCPNEDERPERKTVVLCPLSYVRCRSWKAVFVAFRCPALRTTSRPEAIRGGSD